MARYRIAWLPGDGIGKDVLPAARLVLDRLGLAAEYIHGEIGWDMWCRQGDALPPSTLETMKETDCTFFGAITSKGKAASQRELAPGLHGKGLVYRSPLLRTRQHFELYNCQRPCRAYPGNRLNYREGIDLVVFRENTEDVYVGVEFSRAPEELCALEGAEGLPRDAAISIRAITPRASERILRAAFECARRHERSKVTVVHKANILRESDGVFLAAAHRVAAEYPEIPWDETRIDTMCMRLLKSPLDYDVIVSTNLFSDILSDLCAQMVGGMGFAPSANIGDDYALFEPAHGSAPQYAGQNKVNPTAAILAAGMMLDWLGECDKARQLEGAVAEVIAEGTVGTYDMGGKSSTWEMAQAIADKL